MRHVTVAGVLAAVVWAWGCGERKTPVPPPQPGSMTHARQVLTDFVVSVRTRNEAKQQSTLEGILPTKEDIRVLFPKDVERLWEFLDPVIDNLYANGPHFAMETRDLGTITKVEIIDVRVTDDAGTYARALAMIPAEIPACRAVVTGEKGTRSSGTYLFVKARWVWIPGFEGLPDYLAKGG